MRVENQAHERGFWVFGMMEKSERVGVGVWYSESARISGILSCSRMNPAICEGWVVGGIPEPPQNGMGGGSMLLVP